MPNQGSVLRIGFFIDGYTLKKVNEYYLKYHRYHSRLDFRALKNWLRESVMKVFGRSACVVEIDAHYYHPYSKPELYGNYDEECGIERLERQLRMSGFQVHYSGLASDLQRGPNMALMEDAVMYASYHKIDVVALFSTQGQFAMLPERLKAVGVPTFLMGWTFSYDNGRCRIYWKTDSCLRETCSYYVAMEQVAEMSPPSKASANSIFMPAMERREQKDSKGNCVNLFIRRLMNDTSSAVDGTVDMTPTLMQA